MAGGNQALSTNSDVFRHADLQITRHGSDWLFTVCAIMGVASLVFWAKGLTKPLNQRYFYYMMVGVTMVSCISYFTMGSNLGQVPIIVEWRRGWFDNTSNLIPGTIISGTREIFYVRYIEWFVTMPLLLLGLFLTARLPLASVLCTILADWIMVICFLSGSLVRTSFKWGFYTFGTSALLFVIWQIVWDVRRHAAVLGGPSYRTYLMAAGMLVVPWMLYPVAWGLSEGGNVIHPDSEAIFYGILDIISKVGFGIVLLYGQSKIGPSVLGLKDLGGEMRLSVKGTQVGGHIGPGTGTGTGSGVGSTGQLMTESYAENVVTGPIHQGQADVGNSNAENLETGNGAVVGEPTELAVGATANGTANQ